MSSAHHFTCTDLSPQNQLRTRVEQGAGYSNLSHILSLDLKTVQTSLLVYILMALNTSGVLCGSSLSSRGGQ